MARAEAEVAGDPAEIREVRIEPCHTMQARFDKKILIILYGYIFVDELDGEANKDSVRERWRVLGNSNGGENTPN